MLFSVKGIQFVPSIEINYEQSNGLR